MGAAVESFAKLGDSIYFEENNETPTLYVAQLVSSDFTWDAAGLVIRQVHNNITSHDPILVVTFLFSRGKSNANGDDAIVHVRIPSWFLNGCRAFVNGEEIDAPVPGIYIYFQTQLQLLDLTLLRSCDKWLVLEELEQKIILCEHETGRHLEH